MSRPAWQSASPRLVLASASAARRLLLEAAGLELSSMPADIDEEAVRAEGARQHLAHGEVASKLARCKALHVSRRCADALVIGADQILSSGGEMWGKPGNLSEARRQLAALRGGRHVLHTAVALAESGCVVWQHLASPVVVLRHASDALLDAYVEAEGALLLTTVGACRIEGPGQLLVETLEGEHAAILGLPMLAVLGELRRRGVVMA